MSASETDRPERRWLRYTLRFVVLIVVAAGGAASGATAAARTPLTAPDVASALALAESAQQPVIVISKLSKQLEVRANPDGTLTADVTSGPAREPDGSSPTGWTRIDTTLADTGPVVEPAVVDAPMQFSDGGQGAVAELSAGSATVTEPWSGSLPSPSLDGNTATYRDVYPGVDLVLTAQTGGFEQSWVITQKPTGPLTLELPLALKGLSAVMQQDGSVGLVDRSGDLQAEAAPAVMWDATVDPQTGGSAHQETLATTLVKNGAGDYELQVTPDRNFLDAATYPVTVDPTSSLTVTTDTYIDDSHLTGTFQNNAQLKAGKSGLDTSQQLQRSLLSFPTGSLAGATIQSATLSLFEEYSGSCTPTQTDVYNVTASWDGTVTWNSQPAIGELYAASATGVGFGSACPDATVTFSAGGAGSNTLTSLVQGWADGSIPNNGVEIRAHNETSTASYKRFTSTDAGANQPSLTVTYQPITLDYFGPADGPAIDDPQPLFLAAVSTPGGSDSVFADFRLMNASCTQTIASGTGTTVSQDADSVWQTPAGVTLTIGQPYGLQVQAETTAGLSSGWSSCQTFQEGAQLTATGPASAAVSTNLRPTLQATLGSDSAVSVAPTFTIYNEADDSVVASGTGTLAAAGQASSWTAPQGVLSAGGRYYWLVSASNALPSLASSYYPVGSGARAVLTAPTSNSALGFSETLTADTSGFDAGSITSATFSADAATIATATTAPYSADFVPPTATGTHTLAVSVTGKVNGSTTTVTSPGVSVTYGGEHGADAPVYTGDVAPAEPTTTPPPAGVAAAAVSVSKTKIVNYALKYALTNNPAYHHYSNDCTNFVSQSMFAGGWGMRLSSPMWFYNIRGNVHLPLNSKSWSVVPDFASFGTSSGRANLTNQNIPWAANLGDVIVVDWRGNSGPVQMNHAVLVTKITASNVFVSYHTTNTKNLPFFPSAGGGPSFLGRAAAQGFPHPTFWILHIHGSY